MSGTGLVPPPGGSGSSSESRIRKFAAMRTDKTAAELRMAAAVANASAVGSPAANARAGSTSDIAETAQALASPLAGTLPQLPTEYLRPDENDAAWNKRKAGVEADLCKDILSIPEDDIQFESPKREFRTVRKSLPKQADDPTLMAYMEGVFDLYQADWNVVKKKYESNAAYPSRMTEQQRSKYLENMPPLKYEVDIMADQAKLANDEKTTASRTDVKTLFASGAPPSSSSPSPSSSSSSSLPATVSSSAELTARDADTVNLKYIDDKESSTWTEANRDSIGVEMMRVFKELEEEIPDMEERPQGEPFRQRFGRRLMVHIDSLTLGVGVCEPLYGVLALYDVRSRKKISENFHFDTNPENVNALVSPGGTQADAVTLARNALFQLNDSNIEDVFLVLRVEKVLEGDPSVAFDRFSSSVTPKAQAEVADFCERLGRFRQPIAWGAFPLAGESDVLDGEHAIRPIYRHTDEHSISDDDILTSIGHLTNPKRTSKAKAITGALMKFHLREIDEEETPNSCVTPFLVPVKPFTGEGDATSLVREIEEFPPHPIEVPHTDYVNTLYVYPMSVNLSKWQGALDNARNITVRVQFVPNSNTDEPGSNAMKAVYGRSSSRAFVSDLYIPVSFHDKNPQFYEEVKITIPLNLSKSHHILFTFYHVTCKQKKQKDKSEETILGYSWLPVYEQNRILSSKEYQLPIAQEIGKNYDTASNSKWVDGKRPLFTVRTKLCSSVYSHDEKVSNFFASLQDVGRQSAEADITKAMQELEQALPSSIVQFSIILLDQLFSLLARVFTKETVNQAAFRAILHVVSTVHSETTPLNVRRNAYLVSYIKYRYANKPGAKKSVFEEIVRYWQGLLDDKAASETVVRDRHRFSWFFLDVITKSILQHLQTDAAWRPGATSEQRHFKSSFLKNISSLMTSLAIETANCKLQSTGRELNEAIAYFVTDAFSFLDRKTVLGIVHTHVTVLSVNPSDMMVNFKVDFIRVICAYEHFVAVCLPTQEVVDRPFDRFANIQQEFWHRFYLVGLLLHELTSILDTASRHTRRRALFVLSSLLNKLIADERISGSQVKRNRVAVMFFPLLNIIIARMTRLELTPPAGASAASPPPTSTAAPSPVPQTPMTPGTPGTPVAPVLSAPAAPVGEGDGSYAVLEKRILLACFLQVLNNIDVKWLYEWLKRVDLPTFYSFIEILSLCIDHFAYSGKVEVEKRRAIMAKMQQSSNGNDAKSGSRLDSYDAKQRLEAYYQTKRAGPAIKGSLKGPIGSMRVAGSLRKDTISIESHSSKGSVSSQIDITVEAKLASMLSSEVSSVILYVFEMILSHQKPLSHDSEPARKMFELLIRFLDHHQSETITVQLLATLKTFILKYAPAIFKEGTTYCGELCRVALKYACSYLSSVRQLAAAVLYLLMKKNFEASNGNGFLKVRTQLTVALDRLTVTTDSFIRRTLATVIAYSSADTSLGRSPFPGQVKESVEKMIQLNRDSIRMNEASDDPDLFIDMNFRVAMGRLNTPDLRLTSLDKILKRNLNNEDYQEAAYCLLHQAALIAECMHNMKRRGILTSVNEGLATGAKEFMTLSPNMAMEQRVSTEGEGIGEVENFNEKAFVKGLESAVQHLRKAHLYETINLVFKFLLPLLEKNRDYEQIATSHYQLWKDFTTLNTMNASGKRVFSSYFRVAFYGQQFGEMSGQQYVYKERRLARLADVSSRMEEFYGARFGADCVELINLSTDVDVSTLSPSKCYIQITAVDPYFSEEELQDRPTLYDRHTNIRRFVFETPYLTGNSGKSHGSISEQCMRKTIVTTDYAFPFIKRRLLIVSKEEINLTPIQVSIESIAKRNDAISAALNQKPRDAKAIQGLLQGSVRLQVNSGPLEIASTFLDKAKASQYKEEHVAKLRFLFAVFVHKCQEALYINRTLIKHDQHAYQEDLEEGFRGLKEGIAPYLDSAAVDAARKAGMSEDKYKNILDSISGFGLAQN